MRLIDMVRARRVVWPRYLRTHEEWPALRQSLLDSAPVFFTDNVTDYMFAGTEQEDWDAKDFPNLAPPFDVWWMESSAIHSINSRGTVTSVPNSPAFGALFIADEDSRPGVGWRWQIMAIPFRTEQVDGIRVVGPLAAVGLRVTESGEWTGDCMTAFPGGDPDTTGMGRTKEELRDHIVWLVKPLLLAVSFVNCRNVKRVETEQPRAARRQWERETGKKAAKGYVLDIEPMRTVIDREAGPAVPLQKALHICRGHFKDYRERGLFGQHKGMFWWDAAVRGNAEHGVIDKDYRVVAPTAPGSGRGTGLSPFDQEAMS